jgi:hypothetical protein
LSRRSSGPAANCRCSRAVASGSNLSMARPGLLAGRLVQPVEPGPEVVEPRPARSPARPPGGPTPGQSSSARSSVFAWSAPVGGGRSHGPPSAPDARLGRSGSSSAARGRAPRPTGRDPQAAGAGPGSCRPRAGGAAPAARPGTPPARRTRPPTRRSWPPLRPPPAEVPVQVGVGPPRPADDLPHAQLQAVVGQPVRAAEDRVQHRGLGHVRERRPEVRPQVPVAGPEQERVDVLGGRRLLEPADHRRQPSRASASRGRGTSGWPACRTAAWPPAAAPAPAARGGRPAPGRRPPRSPAAGPSAGRTPGPGCRPGGRRRPGSRGCPAAGPGPPRRPPGQRDHRVGRRPGDDSFGSCRFSDST